MTTIRVAYLLVGLTLYASGALSRQLPQWPGSACAGPQTHRTLYFEYGDEGALAVEPRCHLEIVTCPSCVLALNISLVDVGGHGPGPGPGNSTVNCSQQLAELSEPPHGVVRSAVRCAAEYITRTRSVSVRALSVGLLLHYRAQRNRISLRGSAGQAGRLSSPYFPHPYPHDLNVEYVITCSTEGCVISLLFCDFQLAPNSIVQLFDWNGARLDVVTGAHFRPPPVVSTGPRLVMRFYANGGSAPGYVASYTLLTAEKAATSPPPLTDCGGHVDDLGGAITMMEMTARGGARDAAAPVSHYDCLWIVRPALAAVPRLHFSTHVYLKIEDLSNMGAGTRLAVHQGTTSDGRLLELLKVSGDHNASELEADEAELVLNPREHVAPVSVGFYVRLRGAFGPDSRIAIAYAAFSYARGDAHCSGAGEHLCENRRCISRRLFCDGFDQCGDGTDEPAACYGGSAETGGGGSAGDNGGASRPPSWYSRSEPPNYLFPRVDPYGDLRTATLVFVTSSLGLVVVVCALFVLLYRINSRGGNSRSNIRNGDRQHAQRVGSPHRDPHVTHIMAAIDTLLDEEAAANGELLVDEPPTYEPPPGYEECVIKVSAPAASVPRRPTRRNRRKCRNQGARSRPEPPLTPPPRYEEAARAMRARRRWRSHGELIGSSGRATVVRVCTLLTERSDTASDSELLNMYETPPPECCCPLPCCCTTSPHVRPNPNKFYTR